MIILILLGLLASTMPIINSWFWGIYIFAWVIKILWLVLGIVVVAIQSSSNDFDFNKKL